MAIAQHNELNRQGERVHPEQNRRILSQEEIDQLLGVDSERDFLREEVDGDEGHEQRWHLAQEEIDSLLSGGTITEAIGDDARLVAESAEGIEHDGERERIMHNKELIENEAAARISDLERGAREEIMAIMANEAAERVEDTEIAEAARRAAAHFMESLNQQLDQVDGVPEALDGGEGGEARRSWTPEELGINPDEVSGLPQVIERVAKTTERISPKDDSEQEGFTEKHQGVFSRLSQSAREFAGRMYEGVKLRTLDRMSLALNSKLFERADAKVKELETRLSAIKEGGQDIKRQLNKLDRSFRRRESSQVYMTDATRAAAEKERAQLEERLASSGERIREIESQLSEAMQTRNEYQAKIDAIRAEVGEFVQERVRPHLETAERLTTTAQEHKELIKQQRRVQATAQRELAKLEQRAADPKLFDFERQEAQEQITELRRELEKTTRIIGRAEDKQKEIAASQENVQPNIDYWRRFEESFYPPEEASNGSKYQIASAEIFERADTLDLDEYLKVWTRIFSETIDRKRVKKIREIITNFPKSTIDSIEESIRLENEKLPRKDRLSREELDSKLGVVRNIYNQYLEAQPRRIE